MSVGLAGSATRPMRIRVILRRYPQQQPRNRSTDRARSAQGNRLPIQRSGPPNRRLRCHSRSTTARRTLRTAPRARTSGPELDRSSISQACLAAHRAQDRHSATSGWLPRCTMRVGSSVRPQHQHSEGEPNSSSTVVRDGLMTPPFASAGTGDRRRSGTRSHSFAFELSVAPKPLTNVEALAAASPSVQRSPPRQDQHCRTTRLR